MSDSLSNHNMDCSMSGTGERFQMTFSYVPVQDDINLLPRTQECLTKIIVSRDSICSSGANSSVFVPMDVDAGAESNTK